MGPVLNLGQGNPFLTSHITASTLCQQARYAVEISTKKITVSFSWFVRCDQSSGPWSDDHQFEVVQNFWPGSGSNDIRRPKEIQQSHFTCNMTKVQACSSFTANPTWSITKVECILHILNDWIRNDQYNPDYPDWLVVCRYRTVKIEIRRISLGFYCIHAIFFIN